MKKSHFQRSEILLTLRLDNFEDWNLENINARQATMSEVAFNIWNFLKIIFLLLGLRLFHPLAPSLVTLVYRLCRKCHCHNKLLFSSLTAASTIKNTDYERLNLLIQLDTTEIPSIKINSLNMHQVALRYYIKAIFIVIEFTSQLTYDQAI